MSVPSLADAKKWLEVDFTDDDSVITDCLSAATRLVAQRVGADIGTGSAGWMDITKGQRHVELSALRKYELNEPTSLTIRAVTTEPSKVETTQTSGYVFLDDDWNARLTIGELVWDAFDTELGTATVDSAFPVQIKLSTGVAAADIPAEWRTCILQITAELYSNRGDMPGGRPEIVEAYLSRIGSLL